MLATKTSTPVDDFDAFLENPLGYKFTIHQVDGLGEVVKELHKDSEGYIASTYFDEEGNMKQNFYKVEDFDCETENAFFSVNTFYTKWRNRFCLLELKAFYSDLDVYKMELTHEQVVWLLEEDVFGIKIPYPTWLINSGNGLYYILKIDNCARVRKNDKIDFETLEKWETCMQYICDTLEWFCADKIATDASRVLRIDGTQNTKYHQRKEVKIYKAYGNTIGDIDEFIEMWLPDEYIQPKTNVLHYDKEKIKKARENGKRYGKSLKKLNLERMRDIMRLVQMRGGDCEGTRNYMLLLYTYHTLQTNEGDLEQATKDAHHLNQLFKKPERPSQLNATIRAAHKAYLQWVSGEKVLVNGKWCRKGYNYTNEKLIEILQISEKEQRKLKTIKSKKIVQEKRNQKRREKRRNANGLTQREQQKQDTIAKIMSLKEQGLNNTEIAKRLGISRQTVSRYVNQYMS